MGSGNIAILGGGVAGMSAAIRLAEETAGEIDLYSNDLGGEYLSGGLKYLHATSHMMNFVMKTMKMAAHIEKVIGAVEVADRIHPHPESFWREPQWGDLVQRDYFTKTRGTKVTFNDTCMNNPFRANSLELKLVPTEGIQTLVVNMQNHIARHSRIKFHKMDINELSLASIINDYKYVIYTLPIQLLGNQIGYNFDFEFRPLNILRYEAFAGVWPLWMDYIYIPSPEYKFHRISLFQLNKSFTIDVEYNGGVDETVSDDVSKFMMQYFPTVGYEEISKYQMKVKGHLVTQKRETPPSIPANVFLLGRFAQWNSRVTFDNVLESVESIIEAIHKKGE